MPDTVTFDSSIGTVQVLADGQWEWQFDGTVEESDAQVVTITVTDEHRAQESIEFTLEVTPRQFSIEVEVSHIALEDGDLHIGGTDGNDRIFVLPGRARDAAGSVRVRVNKTLYDPMVVTGSIVADGGDGNDLIRISPLVTNVTRLSGGAGNDRIFAGAGFAEIYGESGKDRLVAGREGADLYGGDGDDVLAGNNGDDRLFADAEMV